MSDPDKPSADEQPTVPVPPESTPPATPDAAPTESLPLEVMPGTAKTTPGDTGQALVVVPPNPPAPKIPPVPAVPIDYAIPASKTWIPTPALIKNVGCIFKMLFGFTVLLILGYVMLMALNPKAREWALQGSQPDEPGSAAFGSRGGSGSSGGSSGIGGGRGPTPFKAMNQILAIPAQALGKTDDVVQANNARAGLLDGMIAEEETSAKAGGGGKGGSRPPVNPFATSASTGTPGAKAGPAGKAAKGGKEAEPTEEEQRAANTARLLALQEKIDAARASGEIPAPTNAVRVTAVAQASEVLSPVTLPGGVIIRPASPEGTPAPTRAFLYWIVNLNISGINPPRLLINGRLVHEKQEISIPLGVTFEQMDTANKLLVFKDKTGAVVTRSY